MILIQHGNVKEKLNIHYKQMATDYAAAIAASLKKYAIATGTSSNYPNLDQICSDLAWGGLQEAPVFSVLFPEGSAERSRILNRFICEQIGNPYGSGTPNVQSPVGQPCN